MNYQSSTRSVYPGPYYVNDFDEIEYARLFNGGKKLTCKFTKDFGGLICYNDPDIPAP